MIKKTTFLFILFISSFLYSQEKEFMVYFDFDISEANSSSSQKLNDWILKDRNVVVSKIYGYCDAVGSNEYNDYLSLKRAEFVRDIFSSKNIKMNESVEVKGFGENFNLSSVDSQNRKVIFFYSNQIVVKPKVIEAQMTTDIKKLNIGEKLKLKNLNFYDQSGIIVPASKPILQELLQIMKENSKLKIEIQGHICCQPKTDIADIAKVRAHTIYRFLIDNGIEKERLNYKSFGSSMPIYKIPEKNEFEKDENRRVEIMIIENK